MATSPDRAAALFIADSSQTAADLQRALTGGAYRCNIMMVANGEQALAILRHESRARKMPPCPHVLVIYGGLGDGRAAGLIQALRADATYGSIPLIAVVAAESEAEASPSLRLDPFAMARLQPLLLERGFWWVMAKLG